MSSVLQYYRSIESRWGYRLFLHGVRHFGYYPEGRRTSHKQAQRLMMDQVALKLDLQEGARVLDAGCGEGATALYLAENYGYQVSGVDLLPESIRLAQRTAKEKHIETVHFEVGDFQKLPFEDDSMDGIYALETFTHATDFTAALREFWRVLKPGGKLVIFDYTTTPLEEINDAAIRKSSRAIAKGAAIPGLLAFTHGYFEQTLPQAGFEDAIVENLTPRVMPMIQWFTTIARIPHLFVRALGKEEMYPNITSGALGVKVTENDWWRFVAVSAQKRAARG